jgi:hypothetical protein
MPAAIAGLVRAWVLRKKFMLRFSRCGKVSAWSSSVVSPFSTESENKENDKDGKTKKEGVSESHGVEIEILSALM